MGRPKGRPPLAEARTLPRRWTRRLADVTVGWKIGLAAATMAPLAALVAALGLHSTAFLEKSRAGERLR